MPKKPPSAPVILKSMRTDKEIFQKDIERIMEDLSTAEGKKKEKLQQEKTAAEKELRLLDEQIKILEKLEAKSKLRPIKILDL